MVRRLRVVVEGVVVVLVAEWAGLDLSVVSYSMALAISKAFVVA